MNCSFCVSSDINERTIWRGKYAFAFLSKMPIVPGHVLICPTRCVARFEELSQEETVALLDLRLQIKKALVKTFNAEGFHYAWNESSIAGQSVPHLHLHVVPRKEGDSGIIEYEPRMFLYRPGSRKESSQEELKEIAGMIKKYF